MTTALVAHQGPEILLAVVGPEFGGSKRIGAGLGEIHGVGSV